MTTIAEQTFTQIADKSFLDKKQTENYDWTLSTSGSSLLDLFYLSVRTLSIVELEDLINNCYNEYEKDINGIRHLIIQIFHMRAIRGKGKGEKKLFHHAFIMLYKKFPKTFCELVSVIPYYGSWQDLNIIATLALKNNYSDLLDTCVSCFSKQLIVDYNNQNNDISFAGKWAPRENKKFDDISKLMIEKVWQMYKVNGVKSKHKNFRTIITHLTRKLNVPEVLMSAKLWSEIKIKHFASVSLQKNTKFLADEDKDGNRKHPNDINRSNLREKFIDHLTNKDINVSELEPHTLVKKIMDSCNGKNLSNIDKLVLNKSYEYYLKHVQNLLQENQTAAKTLGKIIPLCDVSGSMTGIPMYVAIALSLLISNFTLEDFRNRILTFESNPTWHKVDPEDTFVNQVIKLSRAPWGGSTNIDKALNRIYIVLEEMKNRNGSVNQDQVPDLIIFSDMQFDQARGNNNYYGNQVSVQDWNTCYERIEEKFKNLNVDPPKIIYWNLRSSYVGNHAPVKSDQKNVQMLSGYNPSLFKAILFGEEETVFQEEDKDGNLIIKKQKVVLSPWETLIKVIDDFESSQIDKILSESKEGIFSIQ